MKSAFRPKWFQVLLHIVVWIALFSLPFLLRRPAREKTEEREILSYIISNAIWVAFFYTNAYLLVPRLQSKHKYWQYFIAVLISYLVLLGLQAIVFLQVQHKGHLEWRPHVLFNLFIFIFFLATSLAYRLIGDQRHAEGIAKEKETENLKTELSFLRSQASPHFLFNVLNNMVALARKNSELLEPSLIKLSSLIRYTVYDANEETVDLEKEIDYLESYIDLQQQRFGKKVAFHVQLNDIDGNYQIEPMLLIPFVENAIKHGTGFIEEAQIQVELHARKNKLNFTVRNRFDANSVEIKDKTSGIGLANVRRRLELLYAGQHQLQIDKQEGWFSVSLILTLH